MDDFAEAQHHLLGLGRPGLENLDMKASKPIAEGLATAGTLSENICTYNGSLCQCQTGRMLASVPT